MGKPTAKLTTLAAASIGREMGVRGLIIHRSPVDRRMWEVVTPGRCEAHEPMDEKTWREFIAASGWIAPPIVAGASGPPPTALDLQAALRDYLSPAAIVAIASSVQAGLGRATNDPAADKAVAWFHELLVGLVGVDEFNRVTDQLGL